MGRPRSSFLHEHAGAARLVPKEEEAMEESEQGVARKMSRELSVEDLFAPLNRLDVTHISPPAAADSSDLRTHRYGISSSSEDAEMLKKYHTEESAMAMAMAMAMASSSSVPSDTAMPSIPEEAASATAGLGFSERSDGPRNSDSAQLNSTSDDEPHASNVDDRKQRRMLSNRESARRSRLRKQQHLEELRGHVAQLRTENGEMLSRFNLTTEHLGHISEENRRLRSQAMDLSHQLQRLHHIIASHRASANNGETCPRFSDSSKPGTELQSK